MIKVLQLAGHDIHSHHKQVFLGDLKQVLEIDGGPGQRVGDDGVERCDVRTSTFDGGKVVPGVVFDLTQKDHDDGNNWDLRNKEKNQKANCTIKTRNIYA